MKVKILEGIIISIILLLTAYAVCGCEDEQPLSELHWDVIIEEKREEGYYITEITMRRKEEEPLPELYVIFDNNDLPTILDRDNVTYIGVSEEVFWNIIEQEAQRNWEVSESNEPDYIIEISEPNSIDSALDWEPDYPVTLSFSQQDESDEWVIFEVGEDNEIICDATREKWLNVMYQSMSGKKPTEKVILRFNEPKLNEPNSIYSKED